MNKKELLKQRLEINLLYKERIRKKQLTKAIKTVSEISKIMIIGLSIAVLSIWIFNL